MQRKGWVMGSNYYAAPIRREMMLKAAIIVASRPGGWSTMTRAAIASQADCSDGLVSLYLGSMQKVRRRVMKAAIQSGLTDIIVQSVVAHDGFAPKSATLSALLG
jgi:hypothetical protein